MQDVLIAALMIVAYGAAEGTFMYAMWYIEDGVR